jgi:adenylate cyclase
MGIGSPAVTRVRFTSGSFELDLPAGERLLDALDEQGISGLPIACRGANCGACRVRVERGAALLTPAASDEQRTLRELGCAPDERLACQLVCTGEGVVDLSWLKR